MRSLEEIRDGHPDPWNRSPRGCWKGILAKMIKTIDSVLPQYSSHKDTPSYNAKGAVP